MFEIKKSFSFEAAHRLAKGYLDKCKNIHCHSFKGELTVTCETLDHYDMGIDFSVLKEWLKTIEAYFDHKLIVFNQDQDLITLCQNNDWEVVIMDKNPTSEAIAEYIFNQATQDLEKKHRTCHIKSVMIAETCSSQCTYTKKR